MEFRKRTQQRNVFFYSWKIKQSNSDCNSTFPLNLAQNKIRFGAHQYRKSIITISVGFNLTRVSLGKALTRNSTTISRSTVREAGVSRQSLERNWGHPLKPLEHQNTAALRGSNSLNSAVQVTNSLSGNRRDFNKHIARHFCGGWFFCVFFSFSFVFLFIFLLCSAPTWLKRGVFFPVKEFNHNSIIHAEKLIYDSFQIE